MSNEPEQEPKASAQEHAELQACIDYLHGDVIDDECDAACYYEFARESELLREIAARRDKRLKDPSGSPRLVPHREVLTLLRESKTAGWVAQIPWIIFLSCKSFPSKPWNRLSRAARKQVLRAFPLSGMLPLETRAADLLEATGILCIINEIATSEEKPDRPAIVHLGPSTHVLFTLDFGETKKRMQKRFEVWLDLPEIRNRFRRHQRNIIGTTGDAKSRLKDLAVRRLFSRLGFERMLEFTKTNRKRFGSPIKVGKISYKAGDPKPFHDFREGQTSKSAPNEAELFREEAGARHAIKRVEKHLAKLIPWEFGGLNPGIREKA